MQPSTVTRRQDRVGQEPGAPQVPAQLVVPTLITTHGRRRRATLLIRTGAPLAMLGVWWVLTGTGIVPPTTLSSPPQVVSTFGDLWQHQHLAHQIEVSLARAGVGVLCGAAIGLVLGIVSGFTQRGEEILDAPLQMLRTLPFLALVPLFVIWLGIGELPKVALIAMATVFPVYLNTYNGVRNVDRRVIEAARIFGLTKIRLSREVVLPLALPQILTGFRYSLGISVLALIAAEQINAKAGIGYLLNNAENYNQVDTLIVCVLLYCLLGLLADLLVRAIEHVSMPWRAGVAAR